MSVINKMLRDLDERRATSLEPGLRAGTQVVLTPSVGSKSPLLRVVQGVSAVSMLVGAAAWWYLHEQSDAPTPVAAVAPAMATPPLQAASAATVAISAPVDGALPAAPAASEVAAAVPVVEPAPLPAAKSLPAAPSAPVVAELQSPSAAATSKAAAAKTPAEHTGLQLTPSVWSVIPPASAKAGATPAPVAAPAPDPAIQAQRQQNAAREALVQAQSLYSSGSADAAIGLLQDALTVAERATPAAPATVQLSLVRELARMELAQGRVPAVLELLGRVEPLLAGQADLWAVRANAAQRLGRHQEAVQFYATALQTRPAEQRWLLGSAVSLAALGQLTQAAELAEKARAIGPVSKDVLGYLRQQGVALPDK